jgi:hypothetical protein
MQIERKDLEASVESGVITKKQAQDLWSFWQNQQKEVVSFRFTHLLYYLGGMIAISAISIYMTKAWDKLKGFPLLFLAIFFVLLGFFLTHFFLKKKLRIPAGIMAAFSLVAVPLVVYNIQFLLGFTPSKDFVYSDFHYWINWYWVSMELATLFVGIVMFCFYRFSFLLFPISVILWYMSMDFWPLLLRMHEYTPADQMAFSVFFGLIILALAIFVDFKFDDEHEDYAFWLYIVGVIVFWGGLSLQSSTHELSKLFYCLINVLMLFVGTILNRRVFAVFGVLGILGYFSHLAFTVFADSLGFPIVLVFIGLLIIFAALFFTRLEKKLNRVIRPYIPKKILKKMER